MDFQVSALKWRPQKFSQLVGQEHVIKTLSNAISLNRIGHAYLFSGTRGVGKTTVARIFAKALNCEKGPKVEPCNTCSFCMEIRQSNSVDVLEVDGASNNGVSEVRDLIDNVQYAPSACRFKIYIIDEIHMLSRSAFNALLKTLEEPPSKVVFIFATTELLKIPETILSRCQCFEFKSMTRDQIIEQLKLICEEEGIKIDIPSLEQIAKSGSGSMRDSQSLLDQVIAFSGKEISMEAIEAVLGIVDKNVLKTFFDDLAVRKATPLISQIASIVKTGKDLNYFCRDLIEYVRNLLLLKVADQPEAFLEPKNFDISVLKSQSEQFHVDELHQIFTVFSRTELEMKRAAHPQIAFEMAILRLSEVRPFKSIDTMIENINRMEVEINGSSMEESDKNLSPIELKEPILDDPPEKMEDRESKIQLLATSDYNTVPLLEVEDQTGKNLFSDRDVNALWQIAQEKMCSYRNSFGHFFENCQLSVFPPAKFCLGFADPFTMDLVNKEENRKIVLEAITSVFGGPVELELGLIQNLNPGLQKTSSESDERKKVYNNKKGYNTEAQIIQDALDIFGGKVIR